MMRIFKKYLEKDMERMTERRKLAAVLYAGALDPADSRELAELYRNLKERLPCLKVFGGCCGTDHHHIHDIVTAVQGA